GERGSDFDHEHHRVAHQRHGIQFAQRRAQRPGHQSRIEQTCGAQLTHMRCPARIRKCSTSGPSARAGKNVRAPTITTVPISSPTKSGPVVGSVPVLLATVFFAARLPATASIGMMTRNRPRSIASPRVRLYQGVLAFSPPNALPLFPVALE